jgi:hypothetical protein
MATYLKTNDEEKYKVVFNIYIPPCRSLVHGHNPGLQGSEAAGARQDREKGKGLLQEGKTTTDE